MVVEMLSSGMAIRIWTGAGRYTAAAELQHRGSLRRFGGCFERAGAAPLDTLLAIFFSCMRIYLFHGDAIRRNALADDG